MNVEAIKRIAEDWQAKVSGRLCIGITDLQTGEVYTLNGDEKWPTASVFKVFVLAELYRQVTQGKYKITDRFEMTEDVQIGGSGVLVRLMPGLNPTLYDYAMLMMILSDNTAADFLFNFVGGSEAIRKGVLGYMGKVSGRDEDKIAKAGLTVSMKDGIPVFEEAESTLLCKKLYAGEINAKDFVDESIDSKWYENKDYHTMYIVEILDIVE